jgi:hypothetical protein
MGQLNELQIKAAQPRDKEYMLSDGEGLYLRVRPNGKVWIYRYKQSGKQAKLSFGSYRKHRTAGRWPRHSCCRATSRRRVNEDQAAPPGDWLKPTPPRYPTNHQGVSEIFFEESYTVPADQTAKSLFSRLPHGSEYAERLIECLATGYLVAVIESICIREMQQHVDVVVCESTNRH